MCDCINQIQEDFKKLPEKNKDYEGKEIERVEFLSGAFIFEGNKVVLETVSEIKLHMKYKNKKGEIKEKKQKTGLTHAYCPFCGKAYKEELNNEENNC